MSSHSPTPREIAHEIVRLNEEIPPLESVRTVEQGCARRDAIRRAERYSDTHAPVLANDYQRVVDELERTERIKAPEIVSYEEMAARFAKNIEQCASKLRVSQERERRKDEALRRILAEGENWSASEAARLSKMRIEAREALESE